MIWYVLVQPIQGRDVLASTGFLKNFRGAGRRYGDPRGVLQGCQGMGIPAIHAAMWSFGLHFADLWSRCSGESWAKSIRLDSEL